MLLVASCCATTWKGAPTTTVQMGQTEQPDEIVFYDEPCPRCRSSLRYVKRSEPGKVFCDACGYVEGEEQ